MKTIILIIILLTLIQTTIVPTNLALIFMVTIAITRVKISSYYYALFAGLLLGLLSNRNLGIYPILFLLAVQASHLLKYLPSSNFLLILPLAAVIFTTLRLFENWWLGTPGNYPLLAIEVILLIIFWIIWQIIDQRLFSDSDLKLRVR